MMLENYWYIGCLSKELKAGPVATEILKKRIVLYRATGGHAIALEDRCAHRNVRLSQGSVCGDNIQCPYHGWQYGFDGELKQIPSIPDKASAPPAINIRKYHCVEQNGYIWVCLSDTLGEKKPRMFPYLGDKGWTSFRMKTRFKAPVESCLENFLDCPHATYVHKGWFRSPTDKLVKATVRRLSDGAEAEYFEEPRVRSLVWSFLSPKKSGMRHTDRFIAPSTSQVNYIFSSGLHYIITSVCTPVSDKETEVYTVISFKYGWLGPLIRLFFEPLSRIIIKQDVRMLDAQYENIEKHGEPIFAVIESDLLWPHIIQWRNAMKNGELPENDKNEKHVQFRL
jgi:phenylpropionate dioxygenase-like ring-hydroxylating dioxygenase large terminal subunit